MNYSLLLFAIFQSIAFITTLFFGLTKLNILVSFLVASGFSLLLAGLTHIFQPQIAAKNIGWITNKHFQYEVGIANILVGLLCIGTLFFKQAQGKQAQGKQAQGKQAQGGNQLWILSAVVASTIWGWGNAIGHILSYLQEGNTNPGNIGWALYLDIFVPLTSILLYLNYAL
jgi:hypothetical protein